MLLTVDCILCMKHPCYFFFCSNLGVGGQPARGGGFRYFREYLGGYLVGIWEVTLYRGVLPGTLLGGFHVRAWGRGL